MFARTGKSIKVMDEEIKQNAMQFLQPQLSHKKSETEALLTYQQCALAKAYTPGSFCWKDMVVFQGNCGDKESGNRFWFYPDTILLCDLKQVAYSL